MRYYIQKGTNIESFYYNGGHFKIIDVSKNTDLLKASNPFWWMRQYVAIEQETNEIVEVYVYYYSPYEKPEIDCAIVDGIRPSTE